MSSTEPSWDRGSSGPPQNWQPTSILQFGLRDTDMFDDSAARGHDLGIQDGLREVEWLE